MMDASSEEDYVIKRAKLTHASSPLEAKAWILTAKTLYPNNFDVQFEAYKLDKSDNNFKEAAKCFSYIVLTFQKQPPELWNEVTLLTAALRITEDAPPLTTEQHFYVKMFEHISYEVQQKILLLIAGQSENNLEHCRLVLLLMKRFPQAISTHSPRLVETLVTGISANQLHFRELFINDTLPLIQQNPPVLPSVLVNRILAISFEHYIKLVYTSSNAPPEPAADDPTAECWQKLLATLDMCGRILKWEPFLLFNKSHAKDMYWKRLYQIVSSTPPRPSENKQILFCASIVLMMSLQEYHRGCRMKIGDAMVEHILVQGFRKHDLPSHASDNNSPADSKKTKKREPLRESPHISIFPPCSPDTSTWLVTATQCWQLLHSNDILQKDFKALLRTVPTSDWVSRFVIDLSAYNGTLDVAKGALRNDLTIPTQELYMRLLSDMVAQTIVDMNELLDMIVALLNDLPTQTGSLLPNLSSHVNARHLLLFPLTRRAIVQYCVKVLVKALKQKIHGDNRCTDTMLGNLLVLIQLDWPAEQTLAEQIFNMITARRSFTYLNFTKYIICVDFIEQFMSLWYPHGGEVQLILDAASAIAINAPTLSPVNTRRKGAEKALRDDYRPIIKQQIRRCNEDVDALVTRFIVTERLSLLANMFEK